ncbi:AAA family ATPase [Phocaeicola plebeius]
MKKTEIKQVINDYCEEKGLSKAAFAVKCGVSEATLSFIENGKWQSVSDEMIQKIKSFIDQGMIDTIYQSFDFVDTFRACDKARKYRLMVGITADTGMGKTTALRTYSRQKNVYYVSYDKTMRAAQFFVELLKELSVSFSGSLNEMMNRAAEELNRKESPLLIIDECGKLTHSMILYLQVLRDKTLSNCGIILAGMPYFKSNLQKFATREKEGYAEFLRRVNVWHTYIGLQAKEIEEICRLNGITDKEKIRELKRNKRFGDLMNEIYLYKIMEGEL